MAIKTILFDFGGVLIKTPGLKQLGRLKKLLGLADEPEILQILVNPYESQLVQEICLGQVPEDHLWVIMAEKWHIQPRVIRYFRKKFLSKRQLNKPMVRLMGRLQGEYQTAILSNAGDQARKLMADILHLDRYVDEMIISAEEGLIKPNPAIFQVAMDRLNAAPESSLFIDDYLVNVEAAREFGMHAIQFINNFQAVQAVDDLLNEAA